MGTEKKFYGLIIPKKHEKVQPKSKSIFDSDSDDEGPPIPVRKAHDPPKSAKAKIVEQKLLDDDPSIYEYDNIYDRIKEQTSQKKTEAKKKEPRFIQSLLKAADKRKKDQDRRLEKKIQIERVREGDEFKDKEAFVTSAYKQKMEEMEKEEERERIQNQLDEMMDVRKQNDLSGFYRHYLNQAVGEEKFSEFGEGSSAEVKIKIEPPESPAKITETKQKERPEKTCSKNIRCRRSSSDNEHSTNKPSSSSHKRDRSQTQDLLSNSSKHTRHNKSSDEEKEYESRKRCSTLHDHSQPKQRRESQEHSPLKQKQESPEYSQPTKEFQEPKDVNEDADDDDIVETDSEDNAENKKDKPTDISVKFKKRTVGEVFERAQARYFQRMAARGS